MQFPNCSFKINYFSFFSLINAFYSFPLPEYLELYLSRCTCFVLYLSYNLLINHKIVSYFHAYMCLRVIAMTTELASFFFFDVSHLGIAVVSAHAWTHTNPTHTHHMYTNNHATTLRSVDCILGEITGTIHNIQVLEEREEGCSYKC